MNAQPTQVVNACIDDLIQAWNAHDAARVASFYTDDYLGIDLSGSGQQRGPEGVRLTVQYYLDTFPDLLLTAEEVIVCLDRAAVKVKVSGTHNGVIMNIPATGRSTEIHGVAFLTFKDGKIRQASYMWDVAGFLRGIGLLPDL